MKNPEEVRRVELAGRVETALALAKAALELAPVQYTVPNDHPLAKAVLEAKAALAKAQALATQTHKLFAK